MRFRDDLSDYPTAIRRLRLVIYGVVTSSDIGYRAGVLLGCAVLASVVLLLLVVIALVIADPIGGGIALALVGMIVAMAVRSAIKQARRYPDRGSDG